MISNKKELVKTVSSNLNFNPQGVSLALSRPIIQKSLAARMATHGITEKKVYGVVYAALGADKPVYDPSKEELVDKPDHPTRLAAAKLCAQLRGDLTPEDHPAAKPTRINIIFGAVHHVHADNSSPGIRDLSVEPENTTV